MNKTTQIYFEIYNELEEEEEDLFIADTSVLDLDGNINNPGEIINKEFQIGNFRNKSKQKLLTLFNSFYIYNY